MIVGVGEWGFRELPFEEHCKISSKLGFKYMELGIGGDFAGRLQTSMSQAELDATIACIHDYGLKTPFMCIENDFTSSRTRDIEKTVKRVCDEARFSKTYFSTEYIRLFAGFSPVDEVKDDRWDNMVRAFKAVDAECRELGVAISIETHGSLVSKGEGVFHFPTVSTDKAALKRLLNELPATIGINLDPGNLKPVQSDPIISYLDFLNDRVNYCHLKDWIQADDESWIAAGVGDSDIDWKPLLSAMQYSGVYLIEYEPVQDVEDGIRRSLEYLKRIIPDILME